VHQSPKTMPLSRITPFEASFPRIYVTF